MASVAPVLGDALQGRSGRRLETLRELLLKLGTTHDLGTPDAITETTLGALSLVSGDFVSKVEHIRAWYISNGRDVVLATYTALEPTNPRVSDELAEASRIVASITP